jgi:putative FmdB family regulatory protein
MPFYEYECQACHRVTEVLQKMSDPPLRKCPSCGKEKLQKLISASAFRLSGGGWYETDFKSDSEGKRNLAGAEKAESASETKVDAKTESKPEVKEKKVDAPAPAAKKQAPAPAKTAARSATAPRKPAAKAKAKPKKAPARKR